VIAVPEGRKACNWIEAFNIVDSGNCFVMISPHKYLAEGSGTEGDFIRAGTISDHIAKVEYSVVVGGGSQTRFQSLEITVYVAELEYAHGSWSVGVLRRTGTEWRL